MNKNKSQRLCFAHETSNTNTAKNGVGFASVKKLAQLELNFDTNENCNATTNDTAKNSLVCATFAKLRQLQADAVKLALALPDICKTACKLRIKSTAPVLWRVLAKSLFCVDAHKVYYGANESGAYVYDTERLTLAFCELAPQVKDALKLCILQDDGLHSTPFLDRLLSLWSPFCVPNPQLAL